MIRTTSFTKPKTTSGIRVTSRVKAGRIVLNHNQASSGIRVTSRLEASAATDKQNQTARGLRVKSRVKAGINFTKIEYKNIPMSA